MTAGRGEWRDPTGTSGSALPNLEELSGLLAQCAGCGAVVSATERHGEVQIPALAVEQPLEHVIATAERRWRVLQDRARRSGRRSDVRAADSYLRGLRRLQDANAKAQPVHAGCGGPLNLYRLGADSADLTETKEPTHE